MPYKIEVMKVVYQTDTKQEKDRLFTAYAIDERDLVETMETLRELFSKGYAFSIWEKEYCLMDDSDLDEAFTYGRLDIQRAQEEADALKHEIGMDEARESLTETK